MKYFIALLLFTISFYFIHKEGYSEYKQPTKADMANITFTNVNAGVKYWGIYIYDNPHNCRDGKVIYKGSPALDREIKLIANRETAFIVYGSNSPNINVTEACTFAFSFTPSSDQSYIVNLGGLPGECNLAVDEVSTLDGGIFPVEIQKKSRKLFSINGDCEDWRDPS